MLELTSVIVPTFNRSGYLVQTLESLLAQTLPPAEIIVADDGSSDDTPACVASFGGRVRYFRKENSGKADTLNQALPMVRHPLVWIMDDDDIALPGALERLTALISGRPEISIVYGRYDRFRIDPQSGAVQRFNDGGYWREVSSESFLHATLQDFFVHHPGMLVRKRAYDEVGGFSLKYPRLEDYEMLIRLAQGRSVIGTQETIFLQRQHDGVRAGSLLDEAARVARWRSEEQALFTALYSELPLSDYLPVWTNHSNSCLPTHLRRQALIARSVVMGRKSLWELAFADLKAAADLGRDMPLIQSERNMIREAFFSKYGCPEIVTDRQIARRLLALAESGRAGADIARAFGRAHFWFIRQSLQQAKPAQAARLSLRSARLLFAL